MTAYLDVLRERRRVLQNPYAFIDEIDDFEALKRERLRLENPYAHLDEVTRAHGSIKRFDAISVSSSQPQRRLSRRWTDSLLEEYVRKLQLELWANREELFQSRDLDPIEVLDPERALRHYGYRVMSADSLGQYAAIDGVFEVAATIDRGERLVHFSRQFSRSSQQFTLAHELGHALLHETSGLHRDRAVDGTSPAHDRLEREANRFATLFLMPEKQVRRVLEENVGFSPVRIDEHALLNGKVPRNASVQRLAARHLARMTQFNGMSFVSLAERFRVSVETMAIRLEELNLFLLTGNLGRAQRQ